MAQEKKIPVKLIVALIIIAIFVTFVIQNRAPADVKILFFTITMSGSIMLIAVFLIGVAVGILISMRRSRGRAVKIKTPPPAPTS